MKKWIYNSKFANILYTKVNNLEEYINAIYRLRKPITITSKIDDEEVSYKAYPFDGDTSLWKEYFLEDTALNRTSIKIKPNDKEYPVLLIFDINHKYFHWISLKSLDKF